MRPHYYSCSNIVSNAVLLLLILYPSSSNGFISLSDVGDIVRFSHEVATDVFKAWNLVNPARKDPQYIDIPFLKDREKKLMTKIGEVTRRIDIVDKHLEAISLATKINLNQDIPKQLRFEMRLDSLFEQVAMIEIADNTFRDYSESWNKSDDAEQLERHTLENFATYVVSHNPDSVQGVLDRIHQIISPDTDSIFAHSSIYALVRRALQFLTVKLNIFYPYWECKQMTTVNNNMIMSTAYLRVSIAVIVCNVLLSEYGVDGKIVEEPIQVQKLILSAINEIDEIWSNVTNVEWLYNVQKLGSDTELLKSFRWIGEKIEQLQLGRVPEEAVSSIWSYAKINVEMYGIEGLYDTFRKFQIRLVQKHKGYSRALLDLAESVLQYSDTVASTPSSLEQMHSHIVNNEDARHRSLFRLVLEEAEGNLCHVEQSAQQILYNLYNRLQVIQLKGYTMMQFSWMLLRLYKKGNFTLESQMMQNKHIERMSEQVRSIKETLILADTSYWRCDPKHQVEEETYTQITRLVQGYIQNEVDLNSKESCMENCGYYAVSKQHGCFGGGQFCGKQRGCAGAIYDCQYIDSDMWVCQSDMRKTNRRYDWIEYENGRILGNKGSCARQSKVDSWWRWLFWHCSYCFCMCDDPTNSDRYFNLRVVASDTDNNKVITGVRFIKQNRIIHLQIQEGTLLPFGNINQSSITWRPVDQYTTADARDGVDYFTLSYSQRAFDLDDLKLSNNQVVTGVRFRKVGTHLNLEVRGTRFNFTNGKLVLPGRGDEWISNDNTDGAPISPRKQLVIEQPDNPLHSLAPSEIYPSSNQYLLFTHSDIDLDAAQTTVPFIDTQIVAPQPAVPLSGIGVHYKARRWFGGYIAPKVFTYDYSTHIKEQIVDVKNKDSLNTIN